MHSRYHLPVQPLKDLFLGDFFLQIKIKIFAAACLSHAERSRERHQHMRAESFGQGNRQPGSADCLLKETHDIQMTYEFQTSGFCKFNPDSHSTLLPCRRGIRIRCISAGSSV